MKLTFLGTGTSIGVPEMRCHCQTCQSTDPHDKRLRTSALIETDTTKIIPHNAGTHLYVNVVISASYYIY